MEALCPVEKCGKKGIRQFNCKTCNAEMKWFCNEHTPDALSEETKACKCEKKKRKWAPTYLLGYEPKKQVKPPPKSIVDTGSIVNNKSDIDSSVPIGLSSTSVSSLCEEKEEKESGVCPSCKIPIEAVMAHAGLKNLAKDEKYKPLLLEKPVYPSKSEFNKAKEKMKSSKAHCIIGQTQLRNEARAMIKEFLKRKPKEEVKDSATWLLENWDTFQPIYVDGMLKICDSLIKNEDIEEHLLKHTNKVDTVSLKEEIKLLESVWEKEVVSTDSAPFYGSEGSLVDMLKTSSGLEKEQAIKAIKGGKISINDKKLDVTSLTSIKGIKYEDLKVEFKEGKVKLKYNEMPIPLMEKKEKFLEDDVKDGKLSVSFKAHASAKPLGKTFESSDKPLPLKEESDEKVSSKASSLSSSLIISSSSSSSTETPTEKWIDSVFSQITRIPFTVGKQCHYCEELQGDYTLIERFLIYKNQDKLKIGVPIEFVGQQMLDKVGIEDVKVWVRKWLEEEIATELKKSITEVSKQK